MMKIYKYLKTYNTSEDYMLIMLLTIYPVLTAIYSYSKAIYMCLILAVSIVFTRIFMLTAIRYVKKVYAYHLALLYVATYSTIVYFVSNAIYPSGMKILILPLTFINTTVIVEMKLFDRNVARKIKQCFVDGLVYLTISMILITIIAFFGMFDIYTRQRGYFTLIVGVTFCFANLIVKRIKKSKGGD